MSPLPTTKQASLDALVETELLGIITRAPKGLGWKPSYFEVWKKVADDCQKGQLTEERYVALLAEETAALQQDYKTQKANLTHWPECKADPHKLNKSAEREELKRRLKEIAFINHLGPYKGWLFPTTFGTTLNAVIGEGFRVAYSEREESPIPIEVQTAVSDQELQEVLTAHGLVTATGKSQIYSYKVNTGQVSLPVGLREVMEEYGEAVAQEIGMRSGGGFTVDYMISERNGKPILQPIELHPTPLGIVHDLRETGAEQAAHHYARNLAGHYPEIVIFPSPYCLENGFYGSEIRKIAELVASYGARVKITTNPEEIPGGWAVLPYRADVTLLEGKDTIVDPQRGAELENKFIVNQLLRELEIEGVVKPSSTTLHSVPDWYQKGSTFTKPTVRGQEVGQYYQWRMEQQLPDLVVIKPIQHHEWNPKILHLGDIGDAKTLFKHVERYGEVLVEEMVNPNLILGNGELRVFYQVK